MHHVTHILEGLDHLVVQEIFLTKTAQMARRRVPGGGDVGRRRRHGHEQRASRAARVAKRSSRRAKRATRSGSCPSSRERLGRDWGHPTAEDVWNEVRALSPQLAGMSYARLEALGGLQWPCPDEIASGNASSCTRGCGTKIRRSADVSRRSRVVHHEGPVEQPDDEYPLMLTTGRRLESYNTGVQTRRLRLAAASRRVARHLAGGRRATRRRARRHRARDVASRQRSKRRRTSIARCAPASCS